ncbi:hypothetical protein AN640_07960 [Candidatus Epulonipiscium fishelsonii]|uniref:Uncharacterized protein n=1 Tax=Candidatus Epulonipiscium fishelsonii TaxID=77094 RepID=A0ACC8XEN9_9FIRM|nr:hypothetical protein AN640_07960 [Epulopiscium sp. SCG-D08WGA-EpuloA1]OON93266.1 MAG: hypothetical protein ATN32_09060 [Epulopiscium sp. AS2M-Bin002]
MKKKASEHYKNSTKTTIWKKITELGNEVIICLKSKKLKLYETYNDRTEKWLNLFLKNELDETDPVFKEVLKFYNNCKAKPEVKDMLKAQIQRCSLAK